MRAASNSADQPFEIPTSAVNPNPVTRGTVDSRRIRNGFAATSATSSASSSIGIR
jgi:hypothetical protein